MARNYAALFHEYLEEFADLTDAEFGRLARALLVYSRTGEFPALNGNERFFKHRVMMKEDRFKREEDEAAALEEERAAKGRSQAQERMRRYRERIKDVTDGYGVLRVTERNEASRTVTERNKEKESAPLSPPSLPPTPPISPPYNPPTEKEKITPAIPDGIAAPCEGATRPKRFTPPTLAEVQAYVSERHSPVDPQEFIDFYEAKGWMVGKTPMKNWKAACRNAEKWDRWRGRAKAPPGRNVMATDAPPESAAVAESVAWMRAQLKEDVP